MVKMMKNLESNILRSLMAGMSFANSPLLQYMLWPTPWRKYKITHGLSNALILPMFLI